MIKIRTFSLLNALLILVLSALIITDKLKKRFSLIFLFLFTILYSITSYSQDSFRRHFIITYDISSNFRNLERNNVLFQRALEDLFQNLRVDNSNGSSSALLTERQNGKQFFDSDKDEISFFQYNISQNAIATLQGGTTKDNAITLSNFTNSFLKNTNITWSRFKNDRGPSIIGYMYNTFNSPFNPSNISIPNFVFPLILDKIDSKKPAEEYILIILSPKAPTLYTVIDLNYIKTIVSNDLSVGYIKNHIDNLLQQYVKTDYLNYTFNPDGNSNSSIGIFGYIITPKNVGPSSAATSVTINSDLKLSQRSYQSNEFKLSLVKINFPINSFLKPTELVLTVTKENDGNYFPVFKNVIARSDNTGKWSSNYSNNHRPIIFNKSKSSYKIRGLKITLYGLNSIADFNNLRFNFEIITQYKPTDSNPINYIFYTESTLLKGSVNFVSFIEYIVFNFVIPIIVLLSIILFLIFYGKPQKLDFKINGYLDSILIVDYKKFGQIHTPYKFWNELVDREDRIVVNGNVSFYSQNYLLNWKPTIVLNIQELSIPPDFNVFLKPDNKTIKEFAKGNSMCIKQTNKHKLSFLIGVRQNNINLRIIEPQLFKIKINALIRESKFFVRSEIRETIEYNFQIGNDLGDVWVGLDPGTTGSCISVGTQGDNIILGQSNRKYGTASTIIPSKIIFNTTSELENTNGEIPESIYKYGVLANSGWEIAKVKFQSFKKLLGYRDVKRIEFINKQRLELTGKDLSGLLVKGLYNELSSYLEGASNIEFTRDNNGAYYFNPKRAVIAIPNNFTISKIQDIIDCVGYIKQFKDIRYVYESEAVLFYYLSNYSRFNNNRKTFKDETILVFDMGGASINTTVVSATKNDDNQKPVFYIDFLGKIGYAIGGDTIDYCLIKFILSFSNDFPELNSISIDNERDKLSALAQLIKFEMSDNYKMGKDYLITFAHLQEHINKYLKLQLSITEKSNIYKYFKKDAKGDFKLLTHSFFIDIIYNNVKDAINEVLELSENPKIDKVIFSGRSTFFPYIRETVNKQLEAKNNNPEPIILELEESKTAVAHGACWYGINKNSIKLNNLKTNASFGVKRTIGPSMTNVEFIELLKMGYSFDTKYEGIGYVKNKTQLNDDFALDGAKVNFYQIMGKDASKILSENQKHKFSRIASISLPQTTNAIEIIVRENDEVNCMVELINNKKITENGVVLDQEISEANEEHYTWIIN